MAIAGNVAGYPMPDHEAVADDLSEKKSHFFGGEASPIILTLRIK